MNTKIKLIAKENLERTIEFFVNRREKAQELKRHAFTKWLDTPTERVEYALKMASALEDHAAECLEALRTVGHTRNIAKPDLVKEAESRFDFL